MFSGLNVSKGAKLIIDVLKSERYVMIRYFNVE